MDLALALNLRKAELCLGSRVVSDHARGRTIDDLGPVLADEGGRGLKFVYMMGRKGLQGRGVVPTDHICEQFGKCDRRVVFVERTHDLRTDRESARCTTYGCSYGGQAWQ